MIVIDIESSGLDSGRSGIWQIAGLEIENSKNYFLQEARIDDEDEVSEEALKVIGKSEKDLRDKNKQSQKQLILNFLNWTKMCSDKMVIGHNIGWDLSFIQNKCIRYGIQNEFHNAIGLRALDTHTIAQLKYFTENGKFLINEKKKSDMNLTNVLKFVGIEDKRLRLEKGRIVQEGSPHNALEDCKLTAEAFKRLMENKTQ